MLYPLTLPQVDWDRFIGECQEHLGMSPTRCLDAARIDIKTPVAYLTALGLAESVNIGRTFPGYRHVYLSFIGCMESSVLDIFTSTSDIEVLKRKHLVILTTNIGTWKQLILDGCTRDAEHQHRVTCNTLHYYLKQAGYGKIFGSLVTQDILDGSYILC